MSGMTVDLNVARLRMVTAYNKIVKELKEKGIESHSLERNFDSLRVGLVTLVCSYSEKEPEEFRDLSDEAEDILEFGGE